MGDYSSPMRMAFQKRNADSEQQANNLFQALLGQKNQRAMQETANQAKMQEIAAEGDQARQNLGAKADITDEQQSKEANRALALRDLLGAKTGVKIGDTSFTPKDTSMVDARNEKLAEDKTEGLSKRYEKINGFTNAIEEIEGLTSKTNGGNGGVVTNPDAKLVSAGKLLSAAPSKAVGLADYLGVLPQGVSDERKALERLQNEYQRAIAGARQSDQMRAQERAATGWMASGDSNLVAKGVRALARNVRNATSTIQAGYTPEVRDRVHGVMGNPMDSLSKVYDDNTPESTTGQTGAPSADPRAELDALRAKKAAQGGM